MKKVRRKLAGILAGCMLLTGSVSFPARAETASYETPASVQEETAFVSDNIPFSLSTVATTSIADAAVGAKLKGWVRESSGIHYYDTSYKAVTGWKKILKKWYYFNTKGILQSGWVKKSGKWYYLGKDGAMVTGKWVTRKSRYYYLDGKGIMATGWKTISGKKYFFRADGSMASNEYIGGHWLKKDGSMDTKAARASWKSDKKGYWYSDAKGWYPKSSWLWIDQVCYFFNSKGYMAKSTTIQGYKINASGARMKNGKKDTKNGAAKVTAAIKTKSGVKPLEQRLSELGWNDATSYSYQIVPLLAPFNEYFYIKTWNPDPDSFAFRDKATKYSDSEGIISTLETKYEDVTYENKTTLRVKGGYLAKGSYTDGGELVLVKRTVTSTTPVHNLTTGEVTYRKNYNEEETSRKVKIAALVDDVDYLINTYAKGKTKFFDKLSAVQSGLNQICLYSGVYILGDLYKLDSYPYYGISSSPHVDQRYYIQEPYGRRNSKSMFISALYPYRLDSVGFPGEMSAVAKRLDSTVTTASNSSAHWLVDITYKGVTKSFGGKGYGGGQGINGNQILYRFSFNKNSKDASTKINLTDLRTRINEYGNLTVDTEEGKTVPKLTWAKIRKKVGSGSYVRIQLITSIFGGTNTGYTYLYDDGSTTEGASYMGNVGYMYNTWFEGRYYNKYEYYYPGATLEQTMEDVKPSLTFKDAVIRLPDDGKQYYCYRGKMENGSMSYKERTVEEYGYDPETGSWPGYTTFSYDADQNCWIPSQFKPENYYSIYYKDGSKKVYLNSEEYLDAITITMDEAKSMGVDANTDTPPSEFLIYDRKSEPGTKGTN